MEKGNYKETISNNQIETVKFWGQIMRKESFENITLTEPVNSKLSRGKQQVI